MANQDYTPVEERSYSRIFFVLSMLLVVATLGAVWDEVFRRRPWKDYQKAFFELEYQKTKQEYEAKRAAVADKQQQLQEELARAKAALEADTTYQQVRRELGEVKARLAEVTQEQRFAKSRLDEAYYWYDKAQEERDAAAIEHWTPRVRQLEAAVKQYDPTLQELTQRRDALQQKLDDLTAPVKALEDQLREVTTDLKLIQDRLEGLQLKVGPFRLSRTPEIKQIVIEGVDTTNFGEPLMRIDRCMTCHMGIDRPGFEDAPQPFTTHPDREEIFGKHPLKKFGCSLCHLGQGVALDLEEAHGEVRPIERTPWINEPLLKGEWLQASCRQCHLVPFTIRKYAPLLFQGYRMFRRWGCVGCHVAEGVAAEPLDQVERVGPNLTRVASKVNAPWLVRWIQNPRAYLPATRMPNYHFSPAEAEAVAAYLLDASTPFDMLPLPPGGDAENGKAIFESIGCLGCHAINGKGGTFGPDLGQVGSKVNAQWLFNWIKDPRRYDPHTKMPRLPLTDAQIRDVVAYLASLGTPSEDPALVKRLQDPALIAQGKGLIEKYGCFGCHTIKGMEGQGRIGAELSFFADKQFVQLLFGYAPTVEPESLAVPSFEELAALYRDGGKVSKTWEGWAFGKMKNSRLYSTERIKPLMPDFAFSDERAKPLVILLRTLSEMRRSEDYLDPLTHEESLAYAGEELIAKYNCQGCHTIKGKGGKIAPQLTYEGSKVQDDWLFAFLKKPHLIRPSVQARMPNFQFTDAQVQTLVTYIMTNLRDEEKRVPVGFMAKQEITPALIEKGRKLFWETYPCYTCHRIGNKGGVIGPDLTRVAERLDPDWMVSWIKNPQMWEPATIMPNLGLDDATVAAIVAYLQSLGRPVEAQATPQKEAAVPAPGKKGAEAAMLPAPEKEVKAESPLPPAAPTPGGEQERVAALQGDPKQGESLYRGYCVPCHGPEGRGDGPAAAGLNPKPRNLTDRDYMSQKTDEDLFAVIKGGGASVGLSAAMPAWGGVLQDTQIRDVIAFVRTLSAKD